MYVAQLVASKLPVKIALGDMTFSPKTCFHNVRILAVILKTILQSHEMLT